jgi:phosphate-selective porin OprO/OprP
MAFGKFLGAAMLATLLMPGAAQAQSGTAPAPAPIVAGWQDGFFLQTPNGDYRLTIGYVGQVDGRFVINETQGTAIDTFLIRKVRPTFTGRIARYFDFKMMPDFGNGQSVVMDAYLDIRFSPKFRIRSGKDKPPVGYEMLLGDAFLLFPERALATSLVPNRDIGVQAQGDVLGNRLFYAGGVFNGTPDGSSTTETDTNTSKDLVGRVVVTPWRTTRTPPPALNGLGFALGGSTGKQIGALPSFRTSGGQSYFSYAGASADGTRTRVTPSVFYYYKSFGGFVEYMRTSQRITKGSVSHDIGNNAVNVTGSYVVTGEATSDRGVRPRNNFDPAAGEWGALQLVARYTQLTVDRQAFDAGFQAAGASREARSYTIGANWYPNPFVKIYGTFERTAFDGQRSGARKAENLILFRTQVAF